MKARPFVIALLLLALGAVLGGAVVTLRRRGGATDGPPAANVTPAVEKPAAEAATDPDDNQVPVNVAVQPVTRQTLTERLNLPAVVAPWEDVAVSCQLAGEIVALTVEDGDRVKKGQVIARIDTAALEANVALALANLEQAQSEYDRVVELRKEGIETAAGLEAALALRNVAKAQHDAAIVQLKRATVASPLDGVVDDVPVDLGEYVSSGQMVARIIQDDRMKIMAQLPEQDVAFVKPGEPTTISPHLSGNGDYEGKVLYVSHTAAGDTRTYRLEVAFDNTEGVLRAGQIVKLRLMKRKIDDAVVVPLFAVIAAKDGRFVFVEKNGVAQQRRVELGVFEGDRIQIKKGLREGDNLIVSGQRLLSDGDRVETIEVLNP